MKIKRRGRTSNDASSDQSTSRIVENLFEQLTQKDCANSLDDDFVDQHLGGNIIAQMNEDEYVQAFNGFTQCISENGDETPTALTAQQQALTPSSEINNCFDDLQIGQGFDVDVDLESLEPSLPLQNWHESDWLNCFHEVCLPKTCAPVPSENANAEKTEEPNIASIFDYVTVPSASQIPTNSQVLSNAGGNGAVNESDEKGHHGSSAVETLEQQPAPQRLRFGIDYLLDEESNTVQAPNPLPGIQVVANPGAPAVVPPPLSHSALITAHQGIKQIFEGSDIEEDNDDAEDGSSDNSSESSSIESGEEGQNGDDKGGQKAIFMSNRSKLAKASSSNSSTESSTIRRSSKSSKSTAKPTLRIYEIFPELKDADVAYNHSYNCPNKNTSSKPIETPVCLNKAFFETSFEPADVYDLLRNSNRETSGSPCSDPSPFVSPHKDVSSPKKKSTDASPQKSAVKFLNNCPVVPKINVTERLFPPLPEPQLNRLPYKVSRIDGKTTCIIHDSDGPASPPNTPFKSNIRKCTCDYPISGTADNHLGRSHSSTRKEVNVDMTDVNIQPVSSQQQSRMDPGPQQEPRMGDTPLDMSQFTRPTTSHSQLRAQLPAAPYISREPAGASQPLFPVHTYVVPNQPKQRGNYQKAAAFAIRNSRPQQFFVQRRPDLIPDEGPTVKQHLQQQQKQMKERLVAERLYAAEAGNPNQIPDGVQRTEQTAVVKTFTVVQMAPMSAAPVGIAPPRTVPVPPKNRSRPNNHEAGAPPPPRSRKKANPAATRQLKVIVSPGVNTGFVSSSSAKQQLATAPYVVQTQPLPPTTSAPMPSTSNGPPRKTSYEGHAKVASAPARRHLSADVPPVEYHHTSTQYHSTTEPSTPSIDMSSQPSNGLDLIGNDPFLDTNGFDDLDMNDIVPFNVGDVSWNFQFDDSQVFNFSNDDSATQNHLSDRTDPPMQPVHQEKNQFAKDSNHFGQQQTNDIMISGNTIKPNAPSTSKDDHSLPDDFLAPIPGDKNDPLASLLGDDITALMENDPLLAQVDERAILNDSILNDFPDMLLGDAALRNVLNDGNDAGDADSPDVISLIDWVTNDDHGIGEDEEDFIQNLRDERLENSAPEFLNICGAVQFPSTFDNEAVNSEPSTSTSHISNQAPPSSSQGFQMDSSPKTTVDHEPRPSTSNAETTPSRSRRKQRSPKEEKEKPPKIEKKRTEENNKNKQKKAEIDAIEKEKEARQQAADRERVRQIVEMQMQQIAMEQKAAEAQQKNGGAPARNRNRNRSQAGRNQRQTQRQQQQQMDHPPHGPLVISPQKQAPPPPVTVHSVLLPGPSTVPSHPPPPYQPSAVPMPPSAGMSHVHYAAAPQHPQPVQPPHVTPVAAPASVSVMAPAAQSAVSPTDEQGVSLNMHGTSRPPRPFSEDSGQKFYRNHHDAPSNELRRVASWDGNKDVPISEEHRIVAPMPTQPTSHEEIQQFVPPTATVHEQPLQLQPVMHNAVQPELVAKTASAAEQLDDSPEAALEELQKLSCYADLQKAILSGSAEQMEAAVQKIQEDEQLQEYNELSTDVLWSMVENPRALFSKEELQQLKENLGVDIDEQIQPEDLLNPEGVDKPQELNDEQESVMEMSRTLILAAMLLNTNDEKEEELVYMENMVAEEEKFSEEYYSAKLKMLKECMHSLCYANAALVDEISRLSGRIVVTTEERKILARRHCHHQRNYIRRLQTASKRKTEAEKKRQELLQKNPGMALPLDLKKITKMEKEPKAPQERSKNSSTNKKKKESTETTKKSAATGESTKKAAAGGEAKPKAEKRKRVLTQEKAEKPEKPPRRNSIEGGTPRKKAKTQSDATKAPVDLNSKQAASASSNNTSTTPVRTGQRPSALPAVNNPTMNFIITDQKQAQQLKSPVPSVAPEASTSESPPAQPTTPSSTTTNPDTPISLRKSSRRSAQNINFSEFSPRSTPEPEDSRPRRKPRPPKAPTPVNPDEPGSASKRKRPRKSDTPLKIPRVEDDTDNMKKSDNRAVDCKKAATEPEARPTNVIAVSPVATVEKPLPETVTSVPLTPKETCNSIANEAAVEQQPTSVDSPQTSVGGSEPQDTTTSPDTPASNESEEKSGRSMRPRRQSQLRQTSEMLEMLEEDFDDEPDRRRKRRPRTSSETPKRQSTRTRRS